MRIYGNRRVFFSLAIFASLSSQSVNADGPGFEVSSSLQDSKLITVLSKEGAIATRYAEKDDRNLASQTVIVRYKDHALWSIDNVNRTYIETNTAATFESGKARLDLVLRAMPGGVERKGVPRSATLRSLATTDSIGDVKISAFSLETDGQAWRIWIATSLPELPSDIQSGLARLNSVDKRSQKALNTVIRYLLVRSEVKIGNDWKRVLDTQRIRNITTKTTDFSPPADFKRRVSSLGVEQSENLLAKVPGGFDLSANALRGPGPVMSHPELYVIFWGNALNDPANEGARAALLTAINNAARPEYTKYLSQYDIDSVKVNGVYHRSDLPPRAVGSSNFAAISAIVYDVGFRDGAPIFWWEFGGHDPLYVVLVSDNEVDDPWGSGGWGGYHFVAFSLTHAVLPFPVSLFAHDAIPWLIAKIPATAMKMPVEGLLYRNDPNVVAANVRDAIDHGTNVFSHELVETATDPYPFFGWSDPSKQPAAKYSELADICGFNPSPWAASTVVNLTSLATFWSNADNACVPESRPSLTVFEPTAGAVVSASSGNVVLSGYAEDPVDGPIAEKIMWAVDGASKGIGSSANAGALSGGTHQLTAMVQNSRGLQRTVSNSFSVVANAPKVTIFAPSNMSSFGVDEQIVFRGEGMSFQPGDIPASSLEWVDQQGKGFNVLGNGPELEQRITTQGIHLIRLNAKSGAGVTGTAGVEIHITSPTGKPNVRITKPANNAVIPVDFGANRSAPITFTVEVTDASGASIPATITWKSDVDGALGNGASITVPLRGGGSTQWTHKVTVTATLPSGASKSDFIIVKVGQVS